MKRFNIYFALMGPGIPVDADYFDTYEGELRFWRKVKPWNLIRWMFGDDDRVYTVRKEMWLSVAEVSR